MTRTLLLVGGGHAHVAVLADWIARGVPADTRTVLLTPQSTLRYSGMVPGWIVGQHSRDEALVDLAALAQRAGVELVLDSCTGLDTDARRVRTAGGGEIAFDIASFDTGGEGRGAALLGDDPRLIDVRSIGGFVDRLAALSASGQTLAHVVVAGGGAGGVELAFAIRNRRGNGAPPQVTLVTGQDGLLPGFALAVQRRVAAGLARQGIAVHHDDARIEGGAIMAGSQSLEPADAIITALGSAAPRWVRESGLAVDDAGFISVNQHHQSPSHPHIFAAGDVAARTDRALAHSGVHAVFAGPVIAANLRSCLAGEKPRAAYHPRAHNLYLMNTGDGSAIASYGPFAAQGGWVLRLKHRIDRRWIAKYAALAKKA
ncbi:MAG: FAD-dependent oxidoreductase [Erythrobacter sp.]|nr:FAD-dependent oxidoreductase [Erythrobacter sp.]MDZ4271855.1 FAD-dependent oxidoreductase [Erythrobacter sp.]